MNEYTVYFETRNFTENRGASRTTKRIKIYLQ